MIGKNRGAKKFEFKNLKFEICDLKFARRGLLQPIQTSARLSPMRSNSSTISRFAIRTQPADAG